MDLPRVIQHRWLLVADDGLPARRQCQNCSLFNLVGYDGPTVVCNPRTWHGRNPPPLTVEALTGLLAHGEPPEILLATDPRLSGDGRAEKTAFARCPGCDARAVTIFRGRLFAEAICEGCRTLRRAAKPVVREVAESW